MTRVERRRSWSPWDVEPALACGLALGAVAAARSSRDLSGVTVRSPVALRLVSAAVERRSYPGVPFGRLPGLRRAGRLGAR